MSVAVEELPHCGMEENGEGCPDAPVYTVTFKDCPICAHHGALFCVGHRACVGHGAELRGERLETAWGDGNDRELVIERISATYRQVTT